MPKYKVKYHGWAYVESDTPEEAQECYDTDQAYSEEEIDSVEEVDEFYVGW